MIESEVERSELAAVVPVTDRRRPGRREASPTLLPLLRARPRHLSLVSDRGADAFPIELECDDSLRPARGITLGILLSLPLWAALLWMAHMLLRLALHS